MYSSINVKKIKEKQNGELCVHKTGSLKDSWGKEAVIGSKLFY